MHRSAGRSSAPPISRRRVWLSLAATTAAAACPTLAPIAAGAAELAPEIKAIKDRGELIVGMTRFDSPPFYYQRRVDGAGRAAALAGWDVEFAQDLARLLDVKLTMHREAPAFNDVVDLVSAGMVDLAVSKLSITPRRALAVQFTAPSIDLRHALLVNRTAMAKRGGSADIKALLHRDFDGTLGVIANSSYAETARRIFTRASLREFSSWDEVVDAANLGLVDLAYRDELEIKKLMRLRPELRLNLGSALIIDERDSIAFAVPSRSPQLLSVLNVMLARRRMYDANRLLERYSDIFGAA